MVSTTRRRSPIALVAHPVPRLRRPRRASPAAAARRRNACQGRITNLAGADGSGTTPRLGGTVPSRKRLCRHVRSTPGPGPVRTGRREVLPIRVDGVPFSSDRRAHRAAAVVPAARRANASGSVSTEGALRGAGLGGGISDSCVAATSRIMSCEWGRVSSQVVRSLAATLGTGRWG
jgi:hypothetical protein